MIGVDTNVLARLFVIDDTRQHKLAVNFFAARSAADPAFLSLVVVAEFVWLLDRTFDYPKARILEVLSLILGSPDFVVERRELVEFAIERAAVGRIGVADVFIAGLARANGCSGTATFDVNAAKGIPEMHLLQ